MKLFLATVLILLFFRSSPVQSQSTAQRLNSVYALSARSINLGIAAQEKLKDQQIVSYNRRMLADHRTSLEALKDLARLSKVKLTPVIDRKIDHKFLQETEGESKYLDETIRLQSEILKILDSAELPSLKNFMSRMSALHESASELKRKLGNNPKTKI